MLISNTELKEKLNCRQDTKLVKWLRKHSVPYVEDAKGKPCTTLGELERALFHEVDPDEVEL